MHGHLLKYNSIFGKLEIFFLWMKSDRNIHSYTVMFCAEILTRYFSYSCFSPRKK